MYVFFIQQKDILYISNDLLDTTNNISSMFEFCISILYYFIWIPLLLPRM